MRRITVTTARLNKEHHLAQAVNLELFVDVFGVSLDGLLRHSQSFGDAATAQPLDEQKHHFPLAAR